VGKASDTLVEAVALVSAVTKDINAARVLYSEFMAGSPGFKSTDWAAD